MTETDILRLSGLVGDRLKARGAKVTCAESCTGGWLAKIITDVAGSSGWFDYGFVTYSNQAKQDLVKVNEETLARYGAVSSEVVQEMAAGARIAAGADFAVSVSGIAGPDGGSDEKPVGTVWFGFTDKQGNAFTRKALFSGDRNAVRLQSVHFALQTLLDEFL
ncbi:MULTISPECIES: nicotinamide-nucleotide amidase [unclassified Brenneria]|uniref:nicotinamide-nucleotide amidase n=1 Tax=unclassified Brenneria TaxID=2634434 RepID=UPI0015565727|nr:MULTISPECIES: nicotinamide-nucleotide amidase [unclassified Brenneria]MBJ7224029.1 nicotinamide-nucleotide amidase [Brenneria sp. L3-3C-1]MEE3645274.1 nicotinamide-nucleotide amidase [Brenneria sp. L3_3C_1]MEE3653052.1 nicotinamide-nucleotide amidase [Brenneria sp. HEZEL_4_2_4]NPD03005.1 nicotinamide-nucleotide amidase [Brenneria sp. hezel4-2-4]